MNQEHPTGETDLNRLLKSVGPKLLEDQFVFCSVAGAYYGDFAPFKPIASFVEEEGLTLVLKEENARAAGLPFSGIFRCITLTVHSNLEAVGLTAAISQKLSDHQISANVMAAYYHDHIFVPARDAERAVRALGELSG